jgi:hypothetical protein
MVTNKTAQPTLEAYPTPHIPTVERIVAENNVTHYPVLTSTLDFEGNPFGLAALFTNKHGELFIDEVDDKDTGDEVQIKTFYFPKHADTVRALRTIADVMEQGLKSR